MKKDRDFLHELSSPLAAAQVYLDSAMKELKGAGDGATERLIRAREALAKMTELVRRRKEALLGETTKSSHRRR